MAAQAEMLQVKNPCCLRLGLRPGHRQLPLSKKCSLAWFRTRSNEGRGMGRFCIPTRINKGICYILVAKLSIRNTSNWVSNSRLLKTNSKQPRSTKTPLYMIAGANIGDLLGGLGVRGGSASPSALERTPDVPLCRPFRIEFCVLKIFCSQIFGQA